MDFKISNLMQTYNIEQTKKTNVVQKQTSPTKTGGEVVELSASVRDYQNVLKAVKNSSDMRTDKVSTLKNSIQNGSYKINLSSLADKFVQNMQ